MIVDKHLIAALKRCYKLHITNSISCDDNNSSIKYQDTNIIVSFDEPELGFMLDLILDMGYRVLYTKGIYRGEDYKSLIIQNVSYQGTKDIADLSDLIMEDDVDMEILCRGKGENRIRIVALRGKMEINSPELKNVLDRLGKQGNLHAKSTR